MEHQSAGMFLSPALKPNIRKSRQREDALQKNAEKSAGSKISVIGNANKTKKEMQFKNKDWLQKKRHFRESKLIKLSYQGELYNG